MVEFAFAFPLFMVIVFAIIQFGVLFIWYYSETQMARETVRWLAVNRDATDSQVAARIQATMLPGMIGGTPALVSAGTASTPTVYTIGRMTTRFTPCTPTGAVPPTCTHANRAPGATLMVEMEYDAANVLFFPASVAMGPFSVGLPTVLPAYRTFVMAE